MSKFNEIFTEVENEVNEVYNDKNRKEVIESIYMYVSLLNWKQTERLTSKKILAKDFKSYTADELTRIWGKLAIYQYNLIEYELDCYRNYKKAELLIDVKKNSIRQQIISESDKKPNETDIKIRTDSMLVKYQLYKELHEAAYNELTAMKFSINWITSRIETRIKYLLSNINPSFNNAK